MSTILVPLVCTGPSVCFGLSVSPLYWCNLLFWEYVGDILKLTWGSYHQFFTKCVVSNPIISSPSNKHFALIISISLVHNPSLFSSTTPVPGLLQNSTTNSTSSLNALILCNLVGSMTPNEVLSRVCVLCWGSTIEYWSCPLDTRMMPHVPVVKDEEEGIPTYMKSSSFHSVYYLWSSSNNANENSNLHTNTYPSW